MNECQSKNYMISLLTLLATILCCVESAASKSCAIEEDCETDECCVALSIFHVPLKGLCVELSMEGQFCSDRQAKLEYFGGKYILQCPCQEGMACLLPENIDLGNNDPSPSLLDQRCTSPESVGLLREPYEEFHDGIFNITSFGDEINETASDTFVPTKSHTSEVNVEIKETHQEQEKDYKKLNQTFYNTSISDQVNELTTDKFIDESAVNKEPTIDVISTNNSTIKQLEIFNFDIDGSPELEKKINAEMYKLMLKNSSLEKGITESSIDQFYAERSNINFERNREKEFFRQLRGQIADIVSLLILIPKEPSVDED